MKTTRSYPIWLTAFMLLGPFLMVSVIGFRDRQLMWTFQIVGACMVMFTLFYLAKRLHEHMEEVASLRRLLNDRKDANRVGTDAD